MKYSFDDATAPTTKKVQYYDSGTRGLWHDGWKVVAERGPMVGTGRFEHDTWQLFHTDEDRAEANDLAAEHPDKVEQLVASGIPFTGGKINEVGVNIGDDVDLDVERELAAALARD